MTGGELMQTASRPMGFAKLSVLPRISFRRVQI